MDEVIKLDSNSVGNNFTQLTGRKFRLTYRSLNEVLRNERLDFTSKLYTIEGIMENFSPNSYVVINSKQHGFNIINYKSVVEMIEIV